MIIKKYILLILSIFAFTIDAIAQDCYSDNRSKGISAYNSGKYAEAKKYFQSAQNCDMKPKQNDIATWIGKCNEKMRQTQSTTIQGELKGEFSVSSTKKVRFSKGNLQYQASTNTWKFAEHQYDMIGEENKNISSTYNGWIDLFGWGTSGYNGKMPYMTSTTYSDYGEGTNDIAGTNYDWGVYNKISNGGNQVGIWRTLTISEWEYIFDTRTDAAKKIGVAIVNGVNGLILLPDSWTLPEGLTFILGGSGDYALNTYSVSEWSKMEANGAVFLPAAGYRDGTDVGYVGPYGDSWSSSAYDSNGAGYLFFSSYQVPTGYSYRYYGQSVRLVKDVK